jgi:hypothetical protein
MYRYSKISVFNGEVLSDERTDALNLTFAGMVKTVQANVRQSYWEVVDTATGVVHVSKEGIVTVWTVQLVQ